MLARGQVVPDRQFRQQPQEAGQHRAGVIELAGDAVRDQGAGAVEQPVGAGDACAAKVVEHGVHPVGSQFPDSRGQIGVPVVDRLHSQGAQRVVVARAGRADHTCARMPGKLHQDRAHAAAGAQHEHRLPGLHLRAVVQHLVRGYPVDDQRLRLVGADPVGHLHQVGGGQQDGRGPAARLGQRGHPPAGQRAVHAGADSLDDADEVVAGHERERGLAVVPAPPHRALGEGHGRRLHTHQCLPGGGWRQRALDQPQARRLDLARQHHLGRSHGHGGDVHPGHGQLLKSGFAPAVHVT